MAGLSTAYFLSESDKNIVLIDKGETYYWDAYCTIAMPCAPAWYPEQHKLIEE